MDREEPTHASKPLHQKLHASPLITDKALPDRRDSHLWKAIDFRDGGTWDIRVWTRDLLASARVSEGRAKESVFCAPEVLRKPRAIFQGVREEGELNWLCYCGIPSHGYHRGGSTRTPWPNQVFLVFVNHERVAYSWRWDNCDQLDKYLPVDHENRFVKRVL